MTFSSADRWSSRDHDLSNTSGRRSALTNLELVRPDRAEFFLPVLILMCPSQMDDEAIERNTLSVRSACWFKKQLSFGDAHVVVECASDSLIPKFLRVALDTFWRARTDLCMHGLLQPRSFEVFLSTRLLGWCLKRWIDDAMVTVDFHMLF